MPVSAASSWKWDLSDNGTLTISGSGPMDDQYGPEAKEGVPWESQKDRILRIEIKDGITTISGGATFGNCANLEVVVIPSSVTSIGGYAFAYNTKLKSVIIENGLEAISSGGFYGCTSLKYIALPDSLTKVANISFCECTTLEKIGLPEKLEVLKKDTFYCEY